MSLIKFFSYIVIIIITTSGCIVTKASYDNKTLMVGKLSKRLETSREKTDQLKKKIRVYKIENKKLKNKLDRCKTRIDVLEGWLDETEKETETLKSNLSIKIEEKNKDISNIQDEQERIIKKLIIEKRKLKNLYKKIQNKNKIFLGEIETLKNEIKTLSIENQNNASVKLAQSKEMKDLMDRINELEIGLQKKIKRFNNIIDISKKIKFMLAEEIKTGQLRVINDKEKIRIRVLTSLLFDSKEIASLRKDGRLLVKKITYILKKIQIKKKYITIEGHTDDRGISDKLKKDFPSNWELSASRAVSIVRYMTEGLKINPKTLSAIAHSSFIPVAGNDSDKGRAKNRRVEFVIHF